jgi:hypothetical protein
MKNNLFYKVIAITFVALMFSACDKTPPPPTPQELLLQNAEVIVPVVFEFPNGELQQGVLYIENLMAGGEEMPEPQRWDEALFEKIDPYCTSNGRQSIWLFMATNGTPLVGTVYHTEILNYELEPIEEQQVKITVVLALFENESGELIKEFTMEALVECADESGLINSFVLLTAGEDVLEELMTYTLTV